jgi:type VI secretion system protein ImpH
MSTTEKKPISRFGWRRGASVEEWLFAEPWEFEFYQAVKLLEQIESKAAPPGEGTNPDDEAVRLKASLSLVFPASEVQQLRRPDPDLPAEMHVTFFGLGGPQGPLPLPDTELVLERSWRKDHAMRDFLDIFHHRLLSLLVRARKEHHCSYTVEAPDQGRIAQYLFSLFGLGVKPLRQRLKVPDRALLFYSGLLARHPRSTSGLEVLLSDYFGTTARLRQWIGTWRNLEEHQWTHIGRKGQNQILGRNALVGTRVWDQQGRFELNLGPMKLRMFMNFLPLPGETGYQSLCELTRFYVGPDFEFSVRLKLKAAEVPFANIARWQPKEKKWAGATFLGWTSWLKTKEFKADDSQVNLTPRYSAV